MVDDIAENRKLLCSTLEPEGYKISAAPGGEVALKVANANPPDLVLLDIMMPGMNGFEVCRRLKQSEGTRSVPVIFITANNEPDALIEGFRSGGVDFITKPFNTEEVLIRTRTHLQNSLLTRMVLQKNTALREANDRLQAEIARREEAEHAREVSDEQLSLLSDREAEHWGIQGFVGTSPLFRKILNNIRRLQNFERGSVLISGESGTGKELVARAIHFGSSSGRRAFIPVNCSAIPRELAESLLFGHVKGSFTGAQTDRKGYFELAHEGTLFLDEIGELPIELQPKLLRVLEDGRVARLGDSVERKVSVRVIAASNIDFRDAIAEGRFREDLYFRLARFPVEVPPLRERQEDIPLLVQHFVRIYSGELAIPTATVNPAAMRELADYPFPGNVRELKNIVERALIECDGGEIGPEHLHFFFSGDRFAGRRTGNPGEPTSRDVPSQPSDEERILKHLNTNPTINNTDCRDLLGVERNRASYLLKKLHGSGHLECSGQGRWATYHLPRPQTAPAA